MRILHRELKPAHKLGKQTTELRPRKPLPNTAPRSMSKAHKSIIVLCSAPWLLKPAFRSEALSVFAPHLGAEVNGNRMCHNSRPFRDILAKDARVLHRELGDHGYGRVEAQD